MEFPEPDFDEMMEFELDLLRNELQKKIDDLNDQIKEATVRLNNLNQDAQC